MSEDFEPFVPVPESVAAGAWLLLRQIRHLGANPDLLSDRRRLILYLQSLAEFATPLLKDCGPADPLMIVRKAMTCLDDIDRGGTPNAMFVPEFRGRGKPPMPSALGHVQGLIVQAMERLIDEGVPEHVAYERAAITYNAVVPLPAGADAKPATAKTMQELKTRLRRPQAKGKGGEHALASYSTALPGFTGEQLLILIRDNAAPYLR